jgi:poly-gamma-glutamate synthesis protein (capsule biosynthesis protein)
MDLGNMGLTDDQSQAAVQLLPVPVGEGDPAAPIWTYALVAPFYTVTDQLSFADLQALWQGQALSSFEKVLVTEDTAAALALLLGERSDSTVTIVTAEVLAEQDLTDDKLLAILPFDALTPTWKVLRVDGKAPIDAEFDPAAYPLALQFELVGEVNPSIALPAGNYSPERRTVLIMTGVTALTRATAYQMEIRGNTFPGTDIQEWLTSADLTHISNEVPFAENCPSPDPNQPNLIFCSSPDRIELLEYVGTDIIELTGNHMLDYGVAAMNLTLQMYEDKGWTYYAGGWDLADSQTPRLITHNGNSLAFLGCNPVGPTSDFATDSQPGSAPCGDYAWLLEAIAEVRGEGYLPIVTLQYNEDYTDIPSAQMMADFQSLVDAGAVVVNGSQAHTPKIMTFYKEGFIHYGLGNLFFDQMEVYYGETYMPNTRDEFIDRLVFYDNQLVSVELLTAELEDYARPRPMTEAERAAFLSRIFNAVENYLE